MFPTIVRRAAQQAQQIPYIHLNPYRAKTIWPPDFSKLSQKQQFRLERKYRKRTKRRFTNERLNTAVTVAQYLTVIGVVVYTILFAKGDLEDPPFKEFREKFWASWGTIWSRDQVLRREKRPDEAPAVKSPSG